MKHHRWLIVPALPLHPRPLTVAVALSVVLHLAVVLALLLPHSLKPDVVSPEMGTVELLMVEQKGAEPGAAVQKLERQPPAPPPRSDSATASPPPQSVPLPTSKHPEETGAPSLEPETSKAATAPPQPQFKPTEAPPSAPPAAAQTAPVFNLEGTDSESNAVALGGHILPAQPDDRFRNRPPPYPMEAQMRGEHGTVVVVIHVAENGLAKGVDVLESSGVQVLDQAAVTAVRKWRFHPAMKDGRTIPFDMPFRFVFEAN